MQVPPVLVAVLMLSAAVAVSGCHEPGPPQELTVLVLEGSWTGSVTEGEAPEAPTPCERRPSWSLTEDDELRLWADPDERAALQERVEKGAILLYNLQEDTPFSTGCGPVHYRFLGPGESHEILVETPQTNTSTRIHLERPNAAPLFEVGGEPLAAGSSHAIRVESTGNLTLDDQELQVSYRLNATAVHYGKIGSHQIDWRGP